MKKFKQWCRFLYMEWAFMSTQERSAWLMLLVIGLLEIKVLVYLIMGVL